MKFHNKIIIDKVACPLHVLQLKKGLSRIAAGEVLKVIPGQPAVIRELMSACDALGHDGRLIEDEQPYLLITKGAYAS